MTQSTDSIMRQVRGENRMTTVNSIMAQEYHWEIDAKCTAVAVHNTQSRAYNV